MIAGSNIDIGLYSIVDAARLLKTQRRTIARWIQGYTGMLKSEPRQYAPVLVGGRDKLLTFGDLVELMYVREFRSQDVRLETIRQVSAKFALEWGTEYPFATKRFAVDAKSILLKEGGEWRECLSGQGSFFTDQIALTLEHTGDFVSEWRPLGKDRAVVLDPRRSYGKPIDSESGTSTFVLYKAVESGDSPEDVGWWYDTPVASVLDSVQFETLYR